MHRSRNARRSHWSIAIRIFLIAILTLPPLADAAAQESGGRFGNVYGITDRQLRAYLSFIASDELEGRNTPSRGLDIAAKFIATELSRWGWTPAGDSGSYFQRIDLRRSVIDPAATAITLNGRRLAFGDDFLVNAVDTELSAPLVYVQHGYVFPGRKIDPYRGLDIKGKIIVIAGGYPNGMRRSDFSGLKRGIDYESPASYAVKAGAAGIISVPTSYALRSWEKRRRTATVEGEFAVLSFIDADPEQLPTVVLTRAQVDSLFAGEDIPVRSMNDRNAALDVPSFYFSSRKSVTISVRTTVDTVRTQNIAAILPGSDPTLKSEYVAFGAHYDHLGIGAPVDGDSIFNGADDDGSGTAALLAMAEAYTGGPRPKRSLLFVWHCGEEHGLWGSKYFTAHPTVPLQDIVTQLNIDMIGRSRTDSVPGPEASPVTGNNEVFVIGSSMISTELGALAAKVNDSFLRMQLNYRYDDPRDPDRLFYRSDHYNYAKHGIPIIFYFDGIHEDYHKVTDEVSRIDFAKYLRVTRTVFATGWTVANLPHRPAVDKVAHGVFEE